MKTICHLTSVHPYNDTRIFLKECQSLSEAGFEVHLVAPDAPNSILNGVVLHGIDSTKKGRIDRIVNTTKKVYKKAKEINADIYHFHDPELIPIGLLLKKRLKKKVIYDIHEDVPRDILSKKWIPKVFRKIISNIFELFENISVKKFDYLITATPTINERFNKIVGSKTETVNNYPLLSELFNADKQAVSSRTFCYIGAIAEERGIFEMISAMEKTNSHLLLGGTFSYSSLKKNLVEQKGWEKVKELGKISRQDVAKVMSNSVAGFVLFHPEPNHINARPNKLFEYMSAGLPVIASNFPLWKEIIEGNHCGVCVDPLNIEHISNSINWMVAHPSEVEKMGVNGRKAVENYYNWEKEFKVLKKIYNSL